MKIKSILLLVLLMAVAAGVVYAEDGAMFRRNVSKTPDQETERANLNHMAFYVPAQSSDGTLLTEGIEYYIDDGSDEGVLYDTRYNAKPLVAVYIDGLPAEETTEGLSVMSGAGWGAHDAYAALSLDDGSTWKRTNLSNSADLSSFVLQNGHPYPGDAHNMTFAIAGDKVLVGWISKYCDGGSPLYTFTNEDVEELQEAFGLPDLYVRDIWGVAGAQKSVDYTLQGFPEVGEIPYSCVWSARGQLLEVDAEGVPTVDGGFYDIVWTKAERLTSGRRDANRLEMNGDSKAGFMMTWQEDPEGLRPGTGLGPGEGWSGAVVNQQTDLWYSFISTENFVKVMSDDSDTATVVNLEEFEGETTPKVAVPMAMPIRLTDNKMCKQTGSDPYCYVNFDDDDPYGATVLPDNVNWDDPTAVKAAFTQSTASTLCTEVIGWTNPGGTTLQLCQTEDGRVLQGRVGASRPRVNVQPYATTEVGVYDSAIVIMGAEESKALGEGSSEEDVEPEDVGKNMWYYSFDLLNPVFVQQGGMLNWPAKDPLTGEVFEMLEDDFGNPFYETEISRRFAHFSQPIHQIGDSGVAAALIVKQGILNQGGPADIFLRLLEVPDDVEWSDCELDGDTTTTERCLPAGYNPYAYENLVCDEWAYTNGSNPRYLQGLCLSTGINVSSGTIVSCDNGTSGDACAAAFPWDGGVSPFPKVNEWRQCDGATSIDGCEDDNDLDDESWENPYDVAKGHRGFIDGDFIMMMYAWSPNWKANSVGNDHYNLYARRSFDGGQTWTTTPAELGGEGEDGTDPTACENYGAGSDYTTVCFEYAAGAFEQSRNLSQLTGNKVTILDPRYTPTGGIKMLPITDLKGIGFEGYDDDVRDPTKYFIVYETGDNTTVAEGEAVPLDLFYSRATNWGDDYDLAEYEKDGEIELGFDWLEHDREDLSGEAANTANNAGTFYYVIWNQWQEDEYENVSESDAIFRRIMYLPDDWTIDTQPIATVLYTSTEAWGRDYQTTGQAESVTFLGSGRDIDKMGAGIVNYSWSTDLGFVEGFTDLTALDEDPPGQADFCNSPEGKECQKPGWAFVNGKHSISFKVQDDEGNWSKEQTVTLAVADTLAEAEAMLATGNNIYLPVVIKP